MINQRLFDHYGINTSKDLQMEQRCPRPFDTILIDKNGSCYACECQAWLPQSIGNLQVKELSEIIGSGMHQHLQNSIMDGTYRYCNSDQCAYIKSKRVPDRAVDRIKNLRLAIDDSCNLRCSSCRTGLVFHKDGTRFRKGIRIADKIAKWLAAYDKPIKVHIGSDGDPFASHVYRHFMRHSPDKANMRYSLLTNGLMFEEFHPNIPHVMANLEELGISIDGATEGTYERLRLGGRWEKLRGNLDCVARSKSRHGFAWSWHMVVQKDNWREMPLMLELAREYGADVVYFNRIQDWNTGIDFSDQTFRNSEEFKSTALAIKDDPMANTYSLF